MKFLKKNAMWLIIALVVIIVYMNWDKIKENEMVAKLCEKLGMGGSSEEATNTEVQQQESETITN